VANPVLRKVDFTVIKSSDEKCIAKAEATLYKAVEEINIYKAEANFFKYVRIDRDAVDTILQLVAQARDANDKLSNLRRENSALCDQNLRLRDESSRYRSERDQALEFMSRTQTPQRRGLREHLKNTVEHVKGYYLSISKRIKKRLG
jgi:hypothetical protein